VRLSAVDMVHKKKVSNYFVYRRKECFPLHNKIDKLSNIVLIYHVLKISE
jgi:hypothetical protein